MGMNANLQDRIVLDTTPMAWEPIDGLNVTGKLLERRADGSAFTALLKLEPTQSGVSALGGGQEIFVLQGELEFENHCYGPGSYLLIPEGNRSPVQPVGTCEVFWKGNQFNGSGRLAAAIDTNQMRWVPGLSPGLELRPLYSQKGYPEHVAMVKWGPGSRVVGHDHPGGEEFLVLEGIFSDEHGDYGPGTWVRNPDGSVHAPHSRLGCTILVKTGGLPSSEAVEDETGVRQVSPERVRYSFERPFPCDYDALLARLEDWSPARRVALYATTELLHVEIDAGSGDLTDEEEAALTRIIST